MTFYFYFFEFVFLVFYRLINSKKNNRSYRFSNVLTKIINLLVPIASRALNKMDVINEFGQDDTVSIDTLTLKELVQEERRQEISQLQLLSKKVAYLHTDLLYYRNSKSKIGSACYEAWRVMIRKVGGTPNGWRDLGYALGVSQDDLDYIMASVRDDPADMVLKVYRQNEKATIDKILDAFMKMKRYDILKALEEPLTNVAQHFSKDDSGYHSNEKSTGHREIITLKNLPNDLPPALSKNTVISESREKELQKNRNTVISSDREKNPEKPNPISKPLVTENESVIENRPILFLTFAQDGLPTAINIQEYVDNWTDMPDVKVITLGGRREEIYQNPEKFIREYFEKADFIVPIITPGYLEEITSYNVNIPNTSENLDHRYVSFIYNLIVNHYIHATGCLNKKVRSVVPQNAIADVYKRIFMYPDLLPWTYETNFDEQFQAFLKK